MNIVLGSLRVVGQRVFAARPSLARVALGAAVCVLSGACSSEEVNSDAIRTRGMFVDALALAPGDGSTIVRVHLTVGGDDGTDVNLVGDDRLEARVGDATRPLERTGSGRYEAMLIGDASATLRVELRRGSADDSAGFEARLPEPFGMVLETDASAGIPRSEPIEASWEPAGTSGSVVWSVDGTCIWDDSGIAPDIGRLTLDPEAVRVLGTRSGEDCEVLLALDRSNDGRVDAIFVPGSHFDAVQRRGVRFVSTPAVGEGELMPDGGSRP